LDEAEKRREILQGKHPKKRFKILRIKTNLRSGRLRMFEVIEELHQKSIDVEIKFFFESSFRVTARAANGDLLLQEVFDAAVQDAEHKAGAWLLQAVEDLEEVK
jgi:hypothetical protein